MKKKINKKRNSYLLHHVNQFCTVQSVCRSVCRFSVCLLSVSRSVCLSVDISVCLSVDLSVCLSVGKSVCRPEKFFFQIEFFFKKYLTFELQCHSHLCTEQLIYILRYLSCQRAQGYQLFGTQI